MTSIWGFLLQTCEVSIVALLLLFIKRIFKDKLSPKWQYYVWIILFINLLMPAGLLGKYVIPPISTIVEMIKTLIENYLSSNYIQSYETIKNVFVFPMVNKMPTSITDILFIIYILGIIVCLMKYLFQMIQIKNILKYGYKDESLNNKVDHISDKYNLKSCQSIILEEIPTAFVFGIRNPILVVNNNQIDEKIILHELYHVKYNDCLQSVIWSILMCLHWCNPLMNYIFKEIKNDLESLCDQRVLEAIDGEDRRDYGRILLNMCNDSYAYAFNTTSISNGTKHIKTRIESIVRFKKYPRGMSLVSLCIIILLIPLAFGGNTNANYQNKERYIEYEASFIEEEYLYAQARLVKCETIAGAIDVFAKGLIQENNEFIMTTTSNKTRENFKEYLETLPFETHLRTQIEDEITIYINNYNEVIDYYIYNLIETNDNEYHAILSLERKGNIFNEEIGEVYIYDYVPIKIFKENGYKVELNGEVTSTYFLFDEHSWLPIEKHKNISPFYSTEKQIETGKIELKTYTISKVSQNIEQNENLFGIFDTLKLSDNPDTNATFSQIRSETNIIYTSNIHDALSIGLLVKGYQEEPFDQPFETKINNIGNSQSGSSSNGESWVVTTVDENWDHDINDWYTNYIESIHDNYKAYRIQIAKNKQIIDEILIEVGE